MRVFRPLAVALRFIKPLVRIRFRFLGCHVRFDMLVILPHTGDFVTTNRQLDTHYWSRYDTNMQQLSSSDVERMRFFAVKELIKAVKSKKISPDQMPTIAKDILAKTDGANTSEKLTLALSDISEKYNVLLPISELFESYQNEEKAERSAEELSTLLKNDDLDGALALSKNLEKE